MEQARLPDRHEALLRLSPGRDPFLDGALTQDLDHGRRYGRHSTVTVEMDREHIGYAYNLGFKVGQVNTGVETFVWWRRGWILHVHRIEARQPVVFRLGGYALPLSSPHVERSDPGPVLSAWSEDRRGTVLQSLRTGLTPEWDLRLDDRSPRTHVAAPYHATPVFRSPRTSGVTWLAALSWTGGDLAESQPWTVIEGGAGRWVLSHPRLDAWNLSHWTLPALTS